VYIFNDGPQGTCKKNHDEFQKDKDHTEYRNGKLPKYNWGDNEQKDTKGKARNSKNQQP
jgi:hypothetical protein